MTKIAPQNDPIFLPRAILVVKVGVGDQVQKFPKSSNAAVSASVEQIRKPRLPCDEKPIVPILIPMLPELNRHLSLGTEAVTMWVPPEVGLGILAVHTIFCPFLLRVPIDSDPVIDVRDVEKGKGPNTKLELFWQFAKQRKGCQGCHTAG